MKGTRRRGPEGPRLFNVRAVMPAFLCVSWLRRRTGCIEVIIVKTQIEFLRRLQQKDREVGRIKARISNAPGQLQELEKGVQSLEGDVVECKGRIQGLMRDQRGREADIEEGLAHIRKSRGRLMSVKNNKEYQAILKEIEETEKQNAAKEEIVLNCLEELETLNELLEDKARRLAAMRQTLEIEKEALSIEITRLQEDLSDAERARDEICGAIDRRVLSRYEQVRKNLGGIALSAVNNATCSECHLNIPPQMYNELQKQDKLEFCPHCQRIIYWKDEGNKASA